MKKIFVLILALVMVLSLAGCSGYDFPVAGENTNSTSNTSGENNQQASGGQSVLDKIGDTLSQQNAVIKAKSYLSFSAFSYEGLISQLEYEKFSHEDAVFGADNCGADWNEQALKKAKDYLSFSAFSYSGLIQQLEFEKFTSEQAKYGADNCGADWNEQAAKKAKDYLDLMAFSKDGLINQLEFEGFTYEQAVYGATAVGF